MLNQGVRRKMNLRSILSILLCLGFVAGINAQNVLIRSHKDGNISVNQNALPILSESPLETKGKFQTMSAGKITVLTEKPAAKSTFDDNSFCSTPNWRPKVKSKFETNATGSLDCGDYGSKPCYWTKPFLLVGFINGTPELKQAVKEVIAEWTTWANIGFIVDDNSNYIGDTADIKILFGNGGHNSYLGIDSWRTVIRNRGKDSPTMNLAYLNRPIRSEDGQIYPSVKGTILHEFGHALGLEHEHQNPVGGIKWNRDVVIRELSGPPNNWTPEIIDQNIFRALNANKTQYTRYDPSSVMHYSFPAAWTMNGIQIPENDELSETDKAFIASVYPRKKALINTSQYYRLTTWFNNKKNCLGLASESASGGTAYFPYFFPCNNSNSGQLWKLTKTADGDYRLTNYFTGDNLSLNDDGLEYYSAMRPSGNYSNQYWTITSLGSFYHLTSMFNGKIYSLTANTNPNSRTYMSRTAHWANQLWEFVPAGKVQ